ncbi:hypothetical protein ACI797_14675 [Geodermatophilus sp. SYSU D00691]
MPTVADQVSDLDRRIVTAYTDLNVARARFYLDPCGEVVTACEQAEATVNELLEQRFAMTGGTPSTRLQAA